MTRHSKNCTAHTVYTYHERKADAERCGYGTQEIRLGKDSIGGFDCCCISLQSTKDPVVTPDGYLYDRAAILEYLINRKAELQRRMKLYEKQKSRKSAESAMIRKAERDAEARRFLSLNTLDTHAKASAQAAEAEALSSVSHKQASSQKSTDRSSCFWGPGAMDSSDGNTDLTKPDCTVRCPMSGKPLRYKDLISVKFKCFEDDAKVMAGRQANMPEPRYCCAVSGDPLTNATPCVVLRTSGSVVTKEVLDKVIRKDMVDPINGKNLTDSDLIELQRGSLGFADERPLLTAKRVTPSMQT